MPAGELEAALRKSITGWLAYLAPDIIKAILDGSQPKTLSARRVARTAPLPLVWSEQRRRLGFAAA